MISLLQLCRIGRFPEAIIRRCICRCASGVKLPEGICSLLCALFFLSLLQESSRVQNGWGANVHVTPADRNSTH